MWKQHESEGDCNPCSRFNYLAILLPSQHYEGTVQAYLRKQCPCICSGIHPAWILKRRGRAICGNSANAGRGDLRPLRDNLLLQVRGGKPALYDSVCFCNGSSICDTLAGRYSKHYCGGWLQEVRSYLRIGNTTDTYGGLMLGSYGMVDDSCNHGYIDSRSAPPRAD